MAVSTFSSPMTKSSTYPRRFLSYRFPLCQSLLYQSPLCRSLSNQSPLNLSLSNQSLLNLSLSNQSPLNRSLCASWRVAAGHAVRQGSCQRYVARLPERCNDRPPCPDELSGARPEHSSLGGPAPKVISGAWDISWKEPGHRIGATTWAQDCVNPSDGIVHSRFSPLKLDCC